MELFKNVRNYINAKIGRNQEFERLIEAKDISRAISQMDNREREATEALQHYRWQNHKVMKRPDKIILDKNGNYVRTEKRWKLPIPYQPYINEIALVFLYGRPVLWSQKSEGTDEAFTAFTDLIDRTHFNAKIRECKRLAGAETQSAMLFRVFRNKEGLPDVQIRVLAKSKGDDIRVRWDQYENIIDAGWGYYIRENGKTVYHFDIFTDNVIYRCKRAPMGWEVVEEENLIGKKPLILFQQEEECEGACPMIEREEFIGSRTADTNDYFADPIALLNSDIIKNMPDKKEESKVLVTKGADGVDKAAKYLTWDSAPESKTYEIEWLQNHICTKTFTPQIDFKTMTGLTNVSAKALKQMMILADIKAQKRKESHDELLDRVASLGKAIIGNVLNIGLKGQCDNLQISHEFQEPFGEDIVEVINNIISLKDAGMLSDETSVELNPVIKDHQREKDRIKKEQAEKQKRQDDLFQQTESEIIGTAQ